MDNPGVIGSNQDAVNYFNKAIAAKVSEAKEIINMAYDSRNILADSVINIESEKLKMALLPLYDYCLKQYHNAVLSLGETQLAEQLFSERKKLNFI